MVACVVVWFLCWKLAGKLCWKTHRKIVLENSLEISVGKLTGKFC